MQYIPKRHLQPADLPKPAARTLRSKHLPPSGPKQSPSTSRSGSMKHVLSVDSMPSVPSLESQGSPPYPHHFARHPMARYSASQCTRPPLPSNLISVNARSFSAGDIYMLKDWRPRHESSDSQTTTLKLGWPARRHLSGVWLLDLLVARPSRQPRSEGGLSVQLWCVQGQ